MDEGYGIFIAIPRMVFECRGLTTGAMILYGHIAAFTNSTGECFASNAYFSKLMGVTDRTVRTYLAELKENGFIETVVTFKEGGGEVDRRFIYTQVDPRIKRSPPKEGNCRDIKSSILPSNSITEYDVHSDITKRAAIPKHAYGSFKNVLLSDDQLANLKAMFSDYEQRIESMSVYCSANGKGYKNYYAALLNWNRMESQRKKNAPKDKWEGHEY